MSLKLTAEVVTLQTTHRFVIARGGEEVYRVVWVRLTDEDGEEGWGEADPSKYYGETAETVLAALRLYVAQSSPVPLPWLADIFDLRSPARAHLLTHCTNRGLVRKATGVRPPQTPYGSWTSKACSILKIKLGTEQDEQILRTVRDATDKPIRVDANAGWTRQRAMQMLAMLKDHGVEFVEQPLPPQDLDGLAALRRQGVLPVVGDESCIVNADIPRVAGAVDGINIKLAKCGSLREALRMIGTARAHGMLVMVGCMIESSLGITAAAHLAPLVDAADLDGAALTANDPFAGATIDGGQIRLPTGPGLGVRRR